MSNAKNDTDLAVGLSLRRERGDLPLPMGELSRSSVIPRCSAPQEV
jgi:hypothetical protein